MEIEWENGNGINLENPLDLGMDFIIEMLPHC